MNILKQKAISYLEKVAAKTGDVLAVRAWDPATIFEVDLYLPGVNMDSWRQVQHIKVKVDNFTYRDYTPALWDSETSTCTLIIDAGHPGTGSNWANHLKKGDRVTYLGIGSTFHKPVHGSLFCLGDASTIGHFLALEQLMGNSGDVGGIIAFNYLSHASEFKQYFKTRLETVWLNGKNRTESLTAGLSQYPLRDETVYLAGNIPMIQQLKKRLRQQETFKGAVRAQGFWS